MYIHTVHTYIHTYIDTHIHRYTPFFLRMLLMYCSKTCPLPQRHVAFRRYDDNLPCYNSYIKFKIHT